MTGLRIMTLLAAPLLVTAQLSNLTINFYPDSKQKACEGGVATDAVTLTTGSVPRAYTCFNITDLFSSGKTVGFQDDTYGDQQSESSNVHQDADSTPPKGVAYLLKGLEGYKEGTNYTNIWYKNVNDTGTIDEGETSRWVIHTYAFNNCEQVGGDDFETEDYPWFDASCQTSSDGQCRALAQPIKSFAIGPATEYGGGGSCAVWAELGAAQRLVPGVYALTALVAGVASYMLLF